MKPILELDNEIYLIDTFYKGIPEYTGVYLIKGKELALVETGAAPGVSNILTGLRFLGIQREEIKYIIITHVHLDHGGGAGVLVKELPEAKVIVHPRGAKHIINPSYLIAAVRRVMGENFDKYHGEVLAVPEDRVLTANDEYTLNLGNGRELIFYHTPGHAWHHLCIYDAISKGIFSGDILGMRFPFLSRLLGYDYPLPITAPTDFDPVAYFATIDKINKLELQYVYFTHFGRAFNPYQLIKHGHEMTKAFIDIGRQVHDTGGMLQDIEAKLWNFIKTDLSKRGLDDKIISSINFDAYDLNMSAQGLAHYFGRKN